MLIETWIWLWIKSKLIIYNEIPLHVHYHQNDGEENDEIESIELPLGSTSYQIKQDGVERESFEFQGWDISRTGAGMPGGTWIPVGKEDIHLYAIWEQAQFLDIPVHLVIKRGDTFELRDDLRNRELNFTVGREEVLVPVRELNLNDVLLNEEKDQYLYYRFGYGADENHINLTDDDFIGYEKGFLLTDEGLKYQVPANGGTEDGELWSTNHFYLVYYPAKVNIHVMRLTPDGDSEWLNDKLEIMDEEWLTEDETISSITVWNTARTEYIASALKSDVRASYAYQFAYVQDGEEQKKVQITSLQNDPKGILVNGEERMAGYDVWQIFFTNPKTLHVYWVEQTYEGTDGVSVKLLEAEDAQWYGTKLTAIKVSDEVSTDAYVIRDENGSNSRFWTPLRLSDVNGKFHLKAYGIGPDFGELKPDQDVEFAEGIDTITLNSNSVYHAGENGIVLRNTQYGLQSAVDSGNGTAQSYSKQSVIHPEDVAVYIIYDMEKPVTVRKVDMESRAELPGAVFSLSRSDTVDGSYTAYTGENETDSTHETDADDKLILHLTDGYYKLTGEIAPAGYVIYYREVTFRKWNGNITLLNDYSVQGNSLDKWAWVIDPDESSDFSDSGEEILVIANKKGAELPATGGTGTLPYTLSGLMLLAAAALMYGFGMRRRERGSE